MAKVELISLFEYKVTLTHDEHVMLTMRTVNENMLLERVLGFLIETALMNDEDDNGDECEDNEE